MLSFKLIFLRHIFIMILGGSYLFGSGCFILMFTPPFPLIAWILFPLVLINIIIGAYCIAWIIYLHFAQTDRSFNLPYHPKRIFKVNCVTFQVLWSSLSYIPLLAEYGYFRFFILGKRIRRIVREDIHYGSSSISNRLDVYMPDYSKHRNQAKLHPVIVFFYGGAWSSGDKMLYNLLALRLRHMGYVVVVPNYTLYPKAKINVMLSDVKRALVWTERYINKFGGDPKQIHVMGHSSGAHIATLAVFRDAIFKSQTMERRLNPIFDDINSELNFPKISGLILLSGVFDIQRQYTWESQRGVEEVSAMGRVMGDTPESFELNSPALLLSNVIKNDDVDVDQLREFLPAKILIIHGDKDATVPLDQSIKLNLLLNDLNIKDLRFRVPNQMDHTDPIMGLMFSPFRNRFTPHLDSELRNFMVNYEEHNNYFDFIEKQSTDDDDEYLVC